MMPQSPPVSNLTPHTSPGTAHYGAPPNGLSAITDPAAPSPSPESDALTAVRRRETAYRRALVLADVLSTLFALFVAVAFLGDDQLRPATVGMVALVVGAAKITSLYDRDELVLRKSTVDELPRLFQLATLTTFVFWLLSEQLLRGRWGKVRPWRYGSSSPCPWPSHGRSHAGQPAG